MPTTSSLFGFRLLTWVGFLCLPVVLLPGTVAAADLTGEQIYRQQCASCHGASGEGNPAKYEYRLEGELSQGDLAKLIAKTMPKKAPRKCTAEESRKVAAYIYDAFYSPAAQARNKPPRIELSRLTVRQYRNAVADLVGSFRGTGRWDDPARSAWRVLQSRGASAATSASSTGSIQWSGSTSARRVPIPRSLTPNQFSIRWEGSVLAPETGEYEFIVRTEHAARLWVNDARQPLIDAWVKSGKDTEYRGSIFLLGGRAYPLRLEFSKAKQGVDDSKTNKPRSRRSRRRSPWSGSCRSGRRGDSRSGTCRRNRFPTTVRRRRRPSRRTTAASATSAARRSPRPGSRPRPTRPSRPPVTSSANLGELAGVRDDASDRRVAAARFLLALRRAGLPPAADRRAETALCRSSVRGGRRTWKRPSSGVVLLVLKSPRFLYHELGGGQDAYDVACRLSFGLWDSLPDQELLQAAASGTARHAGAGGPPGRAHGRRPADAGPSSASSSCNGSRSIRSPTWPRTRPVSRLRPAVASDLRTSLELFLEDVLWSEASDFRQLLLADSLFLNGRLGRFYGADLPADAPFQKVTLKAGRACRRADAPLPDGDLRLHGDQLAHSPRRVPGPQRPGPVAAAAARGLHAAGPGPASAADHARARRRCKPDRSPARAATE